MVTDATEKLAARVRGAVYADQVKLVHRLVGKHVERDGTLFYVVKVDWKGGRVTVSDTKTPVDQVTSFSIRSFLSKAVRVVE